MRKKATAVFLALCISAAAISTAFAAETPPQGETVVTTEEAVGSEEQTSHEESASEAVEDREDTAAAAEEAVSEKDAPDSGPSDKSADPSSTEDSATTEEGAVSEDGAVPAGDKSGYAFEDISDTEMPAADPEYVEEETGQDASKDPSDWIGEEIDEETGIACVKSGAPIMVGQTHTVPSYGESEKIGRYSITWKTSDSRVIELDGNTIRALAVGDCVVTGTTVYKGREIVCEECNYRVNGTVSGISIDEVHVKAGERKIITLETTPEHIAADYAEISLPFPHIAEASVEIEQYRGNGSNRLILNVYGETPGTVEAELLIRYEDKIFFKRIPIIVGDKSDYFARLSPHPAKVYEFGREELVCEVIPLNAEVSVTSSDEDVASVRFVKKFDAHDCEAWKRDDAYGLVILEAKKCGTAAITCSAIDEDGNKMTDSFDVKVISRYGDIRLNRTSASLNKGSRMTLSHTVTDPWKDLSSGVVWKSSDPSVAAVTQDGVVTAVANGTATITCSFTEPDTTGKAECKVTVRTPVSGIKLNRASANLFVGKSFRLTKTVSPSSASNKAVTWKSSNTKVATVDQAGKVTAKRRGTATITCTAKDGSKKSASCAVTVTIAVSRITLSKTSATLKKGSTLTLTAAAAPSNAGNKAVLWKTSDASVAAVTQSGRIAAKGKGKATITCVARDGSGTKAVCTVTVK